MINEQDSGFLTEREFDLVHKDKQNNGTREYFDYDGVDFLRRHSSIYGYMEGPTAIHKDIHLEAVSRKVYELDRVPETINALVRNGTHFVLYSLIYRAPYREYIDARDIEYTQAISTPRLITHERDCWVIRYAIFDPAAQTETEKAEEYQRKFKEESDKLDGIDRARR